MADLKETNLCWSPILHTSREMSSSKDILVDIYFCPYCHYVVVSPLDSKLPSHKCPGHQVHLFLLDTAYLRDAASEKKIDEMYEFTSCF